ncbi:hypothetical protein [Pseudomonas syringae]|uniref:hypothetical protein n=1 Tax=Pseudomonas syringae TaxID=317 RepID=UPI00034C63CB|nr:hypothetical protein [Pseudomonas syringae]
MKIRGWPRARDDESFTSWLWRCGLNASCRKITEKNVADYCEYGDRTSSLNSKFFDPDFDFENVVTKLFCEQFELPIKIVANFFAPTCHMVIDYVHRRNYCPKCIEDDLRSHRFPTWKKTWSYSFVARCKVHNSLLVPLNNEYFADSNKSWWAFTEVSNGMHWRFSCVRSRGGIRDELLPTKITLGVQSWIELRLKEKARISEFNLSSSAECLLRAYETLLTVFLRARSDKRCSGAAREVMNYGSDTINRHLYTYEECLSFGISSAVPYHRMIALLMAAELFGLLRGGDLDELKKVSKLSYCIWTSADCGLRSYNGFYVIDDYRTFVSLFEGFPVYICERFKGALYDAEMFAYRYFNTMGPPRK